MTFQNTTLHSVCDGGHCWHLFRQKMAAIPPWSLEVLPGFLEPLVADPNTVSSDGEGAGHYVLRASIHIRRWAFSYGGFKFFCRHKFLELGSVTMRIRIWSMKKKQNQEVPKSGFPKVEVSRSLSCKRLWNEQPRSGELRGPSLPPLLPHGHWLSFLHSSRQKEEAGKTSLLLGTLPESSSLWPDLSLVAALSCDTGWKM